jgi:hypothetical protein
VEGTEVKLEEKYNERKRPGKIPLKKALLEHIEEEVMEPTLLMLTKQDEVDFFEKLDKKLLKQVADTVVSNSG